MVSVRSNATSNSICAFAEVPSTDHLRAVEICLMHSVLPPALVLILHSGAAGRQAARLIMIDSEITELMQEEQ